MKNAGTEHVRNKAAQEEGEVEWQLDHRAALCLRFGVPDSFVIGSSTLGPRCHASDVDGVDVVVKGAGEGGGDGGGRRVREGNGGEVRVTTDSSH